MKILGYKYRITQEMDSDSMGAFGKFHADKQLIQIAINLCDEQAISTILHEIIEAINFHLQLKLENNVISPLETGLFQVLTENGIDLGPLKAHIVEGIKGK